MIGGGDRVFGCRRQYGSRAVSPLHLGGQPRDATTMALFICYVLYVLIELGVGLLFGVVVFECC